MDALTSALSNLSAAEKAAAIAHLMADSAMPSPAPSAPPSVATTPLHGGGVTITIPPQMVLDHAIGAPDSPRHEPLAGRDPYQWMPWGGSYWRLVLPRRGQSPAKRHAPRLGPQNLQPRPRLRHERPRRRAPTGPAGAALPAKLRRGRGTQRPRSGGGGRAGQTHHGSPTPGQPADPTTGASLLPRCLRRQTLPMLTGCPTPPPTTWSSTPPATFFKRRDSTPSFVSRGAAS